MDTNDHNLPQPWQRKPVELLRELVRPVPRYAVTVIYRNQQRKKQNRFSVLRIKRAKPKVKKITTTFGMSLFLTEYRMRYAIYMPPNTKKPWLSTKQWLPTETGKKMQQRSREQATPICCDH